VRPALVPITTNVDWVRDLKGITVPDVAVTVVERLAEDGKQLPGRKSGQLVFTGRLMASRRGSFLFTHFGMSGPVALDVSRAITGHSEPQSLDLVCDFLPMLSDSEFDQTLQDDARAAGKRLLSSILPDVVPKRLSEALLKLAGVPEDLRCAEFGKVVRSQLVQAFKHCRGHFAGRSRLTHDAEPDRPQTVPGGRSARSGWPDRRIQFSGRLQHRLAGRQESVTSSRRKTRSQLYYALHRRTHSRKGVRD
jgi:predicted flavoprotein YhiN